MAKGAIAPKYRKFWGYEAIVAKKPDRGMSYDFSTTIFESPSTITLIRS